MRLWGRCFLSFLLFCIGSGVLNAADFSDDGIWQRISERAIQPTGTRTIRLRRTRSYLTFGLNREIVQSILKQAPFEFTSDAATRNVLVSLPLPDGTFEKFRIEESPIMESGLAAKFPEIKTYRGQGVDDPTLTARFGWTSGGFHAFGLTADRSFYVGVYQFGDTENYISFWGNEDGQPLKPFECLVSGESATKFRQLEPSQPMTGQTLRSYTAAIAGTGEYTDFHGGTKQDALNNGIIPTTNGLNAILEREFTVRLVLINNEEDILFTDGATDPYTANDPFAMLAQNQNTVDSIIGSANYDIGHVFGGVGGSGVAYLGVPCNSTYKARGVSTYTNPQGTTFLVDLVAHEVGHQLDANHSYNGTTGFCGPNRSASTAWEPGSGSTIMSYSGSCGAENIQNFSDPYYHVGNYDEVNSFISFTTCDTETATGNNPPTINAGPDYTIPQSTPFILTATGSDPDGDSITYNWEELDLGTASPPLTDDGSRPIFRTFTPSTSPSRTFPRLTDVLDGTLVLGEAWPTTDRTLDFRVTGRDNRAGGGGVAYDTMVVTVDNGTGPFTITSPNSSTTWSGGNIETVQWDVAGTNSVAVSTANVRILLSIDGGQTFPFVLAVSTQNDGMENVTVPFLTTMTPRVKVEAIGNIFFNISTNFSINTAGCTPITLNPATLPSGTIGTPYSQTITGSGGASPYVFDVLSGSLPPGLTLAQSGTLSGTPTSSGNFTFFITAEDSNNCLGAREYTVGIVGIVGCLFCDDFNDGTVSTGWTYVKPDWIESGGFLVGTPSGRKAIAVATPIFAGCANCTVEAEMRTAGGIGNRVWLLAWYIDKKNTVELLMKEENDFWVLKQKSNGSVVAKAKGAATIDPNTTYDARIVFDGNQFQVYINNTLLFSLQKSAGTNPNGTVGFQSKSTTGSFDSITVN